MPDAFSVLILGGTDLTLHVAEIIRDLGIRVAGISHVGRSFRISYAPSGVTSARHADVEAWCTANQVPSSTHENNAQLGDTVRTLGPSFCLAAGWYHMVPASVRALFPAGCAGLHASLLPRLRGGAPLNWAILQGERETGVSLFELTDGVDDGPIYGQLAFPIDPGATVGDLVAASNAAAAALVRECLPKIAAGELEPRDQTGVPTYGLQRNPEDGAIDWNDGAESIDRLVRAVSHPYPGARTRIDDRTVLIWRTKPVHDLDVHGAPGQILRLPAGWAEAAIVGAVAGDGFLLIEEATFDDGTDAIPALASMSQQRFT